MHRRTAITALLLSSLASQASSAPRDVQFRTVDFTTNVVELFNFGTAAEPLDGWRFCTHDDNEVRRYSAFSGLNGMSIDAGESLFVHFDNDASAANEINISTIGGAFAGPLDRGPYGLGLYINSGFGDGANLADHVQWSVDGLDDTTADDRSDEAEGEVWTDQSLWVATTPSTLRLELLDLTGAELHGPDDYAAIEPVPGDYDGNGTVGPEDYDVWESTLGSTADLRADGNGDQVVDAADYTLWRDNLPPIPQSVPEPTGLALVVTLALVSIRRR